MKKLIKYFILSLIYNISTHGQYCGLSFSSSNFVAEVDNNMQSISHSLNIRRTNPSNNCKNVRAYFTRGSSNSYDRHVKQGTKTVPYNLYKESALNNVLKDFGDASSNEYISFLLEDRNVNYHFDFFAKVVDLDSVFSTGPGTYNDLIEVKLYTQHSSGQLVYQTSTWINIQIIIPRYAEISLGPIGSPHDPTSTQHIMSFGNLEEGKVAEAALNIKSTVSFGVYMSSLNGSVLRNGTSSIAYQISVNNSNYRSLPTPGVNYFITQRMILNPVNYEVMPIKAKVGAMPNNPETGEYTDVITITVTPW